MALSAIAKSQDSTDSPIKNRIGLGYFIFEDKVSLAYAFGKKGEFIIQNNFELDLYSDETRLLYAWKSCGHKKLYSGLGVKFQRSAIGSSKNYDAFALLTPIGIEWHPIKRLRKLGIVIEATIEYPSDEFQGGVRYGLNYYF